MTDNQLTLMTTCELLSAFLNKAYNRSSEAISDRMLLKLKERLEDQDFIKLSIEYYDSKSLIGNKGALTSVVKELQSKYK